MDGDSRLIVVGGGEHLALLGGDGGVLLDQRAGHAAEGLDAEGEGGHIQQQHIADIAGQHRRLNGRAHRHRLVRVHITARLLAEEVRHLLLHQRHPGLAADEDHIVYLRHIQVGVLEGGFHRAEGLLHQFLHQGFHLGAGEFLHQMFRAAGIGGDIGQVHLGLLGRGEFDLGLLRRLFQTLQGQRVVVEIHTGLLLELLGQIVDEAQVEVLAAEEGVAVGGEHLEGVLAVGLGYLDDGDVEGAAAEVIHGHRAVAGFLVHAVGEGGGGGLVDDALDIKAGDAAGVLGGLTLGVVEVGGHRDHGLPHLLAEVVLRGLLHLLQHLGGDLRRRHLLAVDRHPGVAVVGFDDLVGHHFDVLLHDLVIELAADEPLDGEQGAVGVGDGLPLGGLADKGLAVFGVGDDGGGGAIPLRVFDHLGFARVQNGHAGVGGAEVDSDDFSHLLGLRFVCCVLGLWGSVELIY